MTIEEYLETRKDATPEDKEGIRGLYNLLKENVTPTKEEVAEYKKRFEDFDKLSASLKDLEDKVNKRDEKEANKPTAFELQMRSLFDKIKAGDRLGKEFEDVNVRAASVMTYAGAYTQAPQMTSIEYDKRIHEAPEDKLGIVTRLNRGAMRSFVTRYVSLAGTEGNAAITAEGGIKPLFSSSYSNAEAVAKKIAVRIKVSEEFEDFTEFYNDLMMRMKRNLTQRLEAEVANGAGGSDHLAGITANSSAFTITTYNGTVVEPTIVDVILAISAQMRALNFSPNVVFLNYQDYASLMFEKDTTGRPISAEDKARISDLTIIPLNTTSIAVGSVLVMDDRYWQLFVNNVTLKEGYGVQKVGAEYLSDLDVNMRTIIAETFVKSFCPATEIGSSVYGNIATIKAAIAKV